MIIGIQMLMLLVPILISYLLEGQALRSANKHSITLHDASLQWLMKIGPKYPQVRPQNRIKLSYAHKYYCRNLKRWWANPGSSRSVWRTQSATASKLPRRINPKPLRTSPSSLKHLPLNWKPILVTFRNTNFSIFVLPLLIY